MSLGMWLIVEYTGPPGGPHTLVHMIITNWALGVTNNRN